MLPFNWCQQTEYLLCTQTQTNLTPSLLQQWL
jgi:hypothetical protein